MNNDHIVNDKGSAVLGLIGQPIKHSLSPLIHNFILSRFDIEGSYAIYEQEQHNVESFLQEAWESKLAGLNITKPYKELVASLVSTFSINSQNTNLSSVNTLVRGEEFWVGTSTDAQGLDKSMRFIGTCVEELDNIVILGNGGVSISILEYIKETKAKCHCYLLRRNKSKDTLDIINELSKQITLLDFCDKEFSNLIRGLSPNTLIIEATGAINSGHDLSEFAQHLNNFKGYLVDLGYSKQSALYHKTRDLGVFTQNGLPMLIEQARLSEKLWWSENPPPYEDVYEFIKNNS